MSCRFFRPFRHNDSTRPHHWAFVDAPLAMASCAWTVPTTTLPLPIWPPKTWEISDGVQAAEHIPLRYVLALLVPITTSLKPFLATGDATPDEVGSMHQAWVKAVLLQVILWSQQYVREGDF